MLFPQRLFLYNPIVQRVQNRYFSVDSNISSVKENFHVVIIQKMRDDTQTGMRSLECAQAGEDIRGFGIREDMEGIKSFST
jgi:hypothetical protein